MESETKKSLLQLGFTENEVSVYMVLLGIGESRALTIAQKAKLSRPYTYAVLQKLEEQGLVLSLEKSGISYFRPISPERLSKILANRVALFNQFVPNLMLLYGGNTEQPFMRWFEGKEGLRTIHEEILAEAEGVDIFGSTIDWINSFEDWEDFSKRLAGKKIPVRDLAKRVPQTEYYSKYYQAPLQEVRFIREGWSFPSDIIIWGDKTALLTYHDNMHGTVIESASIASTLRSVVDILWPLAGRVDS